MNTHQDERICEGEPPLRPTPRHRLSDSNTTFARIGLPLIFSGFAIILIILSFVIPPNPNRGPSREAMALVAGFISLAWIFSYCLYFWRLRDVELDDDCLYVFA